MLGDNYSELTPEDRLEPQVDAAPAPADPPPLDNQPRISPEEAATLSAASFLSSDALTLASADYASTSASYFKSFKSVMNSPTTWRIIKGLVVILISLKVVHELDIIKINLSDLPLPNFMEYFQFD